MDELSALGVLEDHNFFSGVPDSLLATFISAIDDRKKAQHVPAVNEAHAIAIAFGAMLAGEDACVYLQNSGLGNIINPDFGNRGIVRRTRPKRDLCGLDRLPF